MPALVYSVRPAQWTVCKIAGWLRPSVFWSRLAGLRYKEVPIPPLPTPRWVRLRTILGGICGTDVAGVMQRHHPASILQAFSSFPAVLGHENVAVVDEVGPAVTGWRPGDRVVVEPSLSCVPRAIEPVCPSCAAGRFTLCDNFRTGPLPPGSMIGWNNFTGGSWSPYFVAHESQLHRVPDALSDEEAVLTDPIAGGLHAALRCTPRDDESVLIVGGGLLGMGVAGAIRALGSRCRLVAVVRHTSQEEMLRHFGADECILVGRKGGQGPRYAKVAERIGGRAIATRFGHHAFVGGFDIVFDCVGTGTSLTDSLKYARSGGKVIEVGTSSITNVDTAPIWFNEINVIGASGRAIESYQGRRLHTYELLWELIAQNKLDLRGLLTHQFRPDQYREAFATLTARAQTGAIKVAFRPWPGPKVVTLPRSAHRSDTITVYARCYGESVDCYAPVRVRPTGRHFTVIDASDSATQLSPGDVVDLTERRISEGASLVVRCQILPDGTERYRIEGTGITTEAAMHDELAAALGFSDGYGRNLDALGDVLTDNSGLKQAREPFEVVWLVSDSPPAWLEEFAGVFREAEKTGRLRLIFRNLP